MSLYKKLFEGVEGLPDGFEARAETLLTAHINEATNIAVKSATDLHESAIAELTESHETEISDLKESAEAYGDQRADQALVESAENVDKYMGHYLREWAEDNAVAINSQIKVDLAESFLSGVSGLMLEHNVVVPEGESIMESVESHNVELTAELNESTERIVELEESAKAAEREVAFLTESAGLTATEVDRLRTMTKDFELNEGFSAQIQTVRGTLLEGSDDLNVGNLGEDDGAEITNLNEGTDPSASATNDVDDVLSFLRR